MQNSPICSRRYLTIGVLPGWQLYEGNIPHSFLTPVFRGIRSAAQDLGCNVLFACGVVGYSFGEEIKRPAWPLVLPDVDFVPVGPWNTDGLIVVNPLLSDERFRYLRDLRASGFPVIFISPGEEGPTIVADNEQGIRQALDHLAWHGHQRVAFIAGRPVEREDSSVRLQAYRQWMGENHFNVDENLIAYGYHNLLDGQQAMQHILAGGIEFSAVLASNDESAIGAIRALQSAGRRVPEDVAVIGFDNCLEAVIQNPPLTTVQNPTFEIGYDALHRLIRKETQPDSAAWVRTPTRLVIRQSCGCQPGIVEGERLIPSTFSRESADAAWAQTLADALLPGRQSLYQIPLMEACSELVEQIRFSVGDGDLASLQRALSHLFQFLEVVQNGGDSWAAAIAVLENLLPEIARAVAPNPEHARIAEILRTARLFIYQHERTRSERFMVQQMQLNDRIGRMMARLHTALDEKQVFSALVETLPVLGIRFGMVCFYEPTKPAAGAEPYSHSSVRACYPPTTVERFPSREFSCGKILDEPYQVALLPLTIQGCLAGFVAFNAAQFELYALIVRQLETAFENARLYQQAAAARNLAEEADRLKSRFLSTVSHELRTPLSLIVGLSELLLKQSPTSSTQHEVERIHANAQHLGWLIRDVLDLTSSQAGQLRLACEPVDLAEVLQPVAQTGEQLAGDKGLEWRYETPAEPVRVWGDRTRLRQVALNLISNAVKFTARGSVVMRLAVEAGQACVCVRDTGLGIPATEQSLIFDEFRQSERTTGRGFGGLGLGLAISKRLIELHGGSIGVQSSGNEGEGSTLYFRLPLWAGASPIISDGTESPHGEDHSSKKNIFLLEYITKPIGTGELARALERFMQPGLAASEEKTILIVDDEPAILEMHTQMVEMAFPAFRVLKAQHGHQALAQLQEQRVDLVLLDLMMPDLDGVGVLKEMRANPLTRDIPVMVLTAQVLTEEDMAQFSPGVSRVLEKGVFSVEEVLAHMETTLGRGKTLGTETQRLARKAMAYIHLSYAEHLTRESIASYIGVSEDYLARCFQQEVGMSLMTYLTRCRINRAKSLLSAGAQSVTQVALEVGFVSGSHFSRIFRQEVGVSPGAYRHGQRS